ncbi:BTAD domain-containing putative transcriptional regulator [Actinoplanes sp. NPDC051475]|uniref:BTAD domain-containing putative transcriptional regulator n=1 Tax=Actinoplanes sp. NPDC051475 TaxID=3157225 RepID=UPI00344E3042
MTECGAGLDLRLLGPVRVSLDGAEIVSGTDRRVAVLCMLAMRANQPISREEMVTAVWGEEPPPSALGNIYKFVSELRRALEPQGGRRGAGHALSSVAGTYLLQLPAGAVDVQRFEGAREYSRACRAAGDKMAELTALEDALGLWQGEALAGVPGPYAAAQRIRLAELRLANVERRAELLVGLGRHNEAVPALRELVNAYPSQEKFYALLMDALCGAGRDAEALTVHRRARRFLAQLTGAEPGLLLRRAHQRATGAEQSERSAAARPAAIVGRNAEVLLLRRAVAQLAAGTGGHIRLDGGPGVGKSAVLDAGLRGSRPVGYRAGWSRATLETGQPLATLLDCLASATGGAEPQWLTRLRQVPADPAILTANVIAALREACAESPLLLVVDDLQWADEATLRVWPLLRRLSAGLPLLLAAAARPDPAVLDRLGWEGAMPLGPLTSGESSALVVAAAGRPLDVNVIERIVLDAGGNPCYLLAGVAAALHDDGTPEAGVPAETAAAVARHLATLNEPTQHVLRAIAVLGDDCDIALLATATGKPANSLLDAVRAARAAGLLTTSTETMTFRHRIVARALREGTPAALRAMLHRSFAEQLAAAGTAPARVVGQLLAGSAPLSAEMCAWLARNIDAAAEQSPREAVDLLRRACLQPGLESANRLRLTAALARLLFRLERPATEPAEWVAARTQDTELEAEMRLLAALSHERAGDVEQAAAVARWVLGAQRAPEPWLERFRDLMARIRPRMTGIPTKPHEQTVTGNRL